MHPSPTLTDLAGFTGIHITTLCCALLLASPASTFAQAPQPEASRPVGIRRVEYIEAHHSGRHLALSVFYPAAQLTVPAYIIVGASDTQAPPKDNAEFAAKYIPHAQLYVIPGRVDHEIFVNECNEDGKDEFPEACVDAPGVDRGNIHETIADAALRFFNDSLNVP
jgi:hypothetical protein